MQLETVGEVIASRRFTLVRDSQPPVEVVILMGKTRGIPTPARLLLLLSNQRVRSRKVIVIGGVDAFQAMQLALKTIGVELDVINKDSGGRLEWVAGQEGDLGFPVLSPED